MKKRRKTDGLAFLKPFLVSLALFFCLLCLALLLILDTAQKPLQKAEVELTRLASDLADVRQVDRFAFYNGLESYATLIGRTSQGRRLAVLKKDQDSNLYVYDLDQGVSQEQAEKVALENGAQELDRTTFGRYQDQPIWEVKSQTTYYLIDFESGTLISKEGI